MSRLDKLIAKMCPAGVEFKKVGSICEILRGKRLTKKELVDDGQYPVIHGGTTPMGYYDKANRKAGTTIVINTGNAGCVFYIDREFWSSDACFSLYPGSELIDRYLFYFISSKEETLKGKIRAGAMPTIDSNAVKNLMIPIPPLEIQHEIVRILDIFTKLTVELSAELAAREKQYEHYRDIILRPKEDWTTVPMEDLCSLITKQTGFDYSKTIKPSLRRENNGECYSFIQNKDFVGTEFNYDTDYYVPKSVADQFPKIKLDQPSILFSISGKIGNVGLFEHRAPAFIGGAIAICKLKENLNNKYIMYFLQSKYGQQYLFSHIKAASHMNITVEAIRKTTIQFPSEEEQERIVRILDSFDLLSKSVFIGLPAEIEVRQKQYEYYRDRLLSFKELTA